MSKSTAAPTDIPCHAVQSESLLRAHSCSPKRFSGLLDAPVPLRTNDRSPPPDKLDSHRLHIADIHHENSEALSMIDSACVLPAPQMETSGETVTTSAEASLTSLSEHRSPGKSLKASLEIEVAATKDELKLLRQQAAKDQEAIARADRRANDAVAQLQQEQQESKKQMDSLTERVDALKDELSTTERLLATADDKLHTFASHSEQLQAVQKESKNMVGQEQARRRRAEVALEAAVTEVSTAQQGKTMAEMEAEKAKQMLELEVKLRHQISKEKDQVVQQLLQQQEANTSLETRLAESDEALTAAAEEVAALRQLNGGERPTVSLQRAVEDLEERACMAESGRRVAEAAWQDAEEARLDALAARREAETNWQQVSAILEREQNAHRQAITELLSERSARQLAQATLKRVNDRITARSTAVEPLTARTSGDVRASLLVEVKEERRGLGCLRSALVDVRDTQTETLKYVEDLQRSMGAHGLDSDHMHEIESARTSAEQGVRLAMVVVHRADEMLGHVSSAADAAIRDLSQGLPPGSAAGGRGGFALSPRPGQPGSGGGYSGYPYPYQYHKGDTPPLSARGRRSSDCGPRRGVISEDDTIGWEVDSVFPDTYGMLDDMLDSQVDSETLLGSEFTRGALSGPPSGPHSYPASRDSPELSIGHSFSRGSLSMPCGGATPSPNVPLCSPVPSPRPFGGSGGTAGPGGASPALSPPSSLYRAPSSGGQSAAAVAAATAGAAGIAAASGHRSCSGSPDDGSQTMHTYVATDLHNNSPNNTDEGGAAASAPPQGMSPPSQGLQPPPASKQHSTPPSNQAKRPLPPRGRTCPALPGSSGPSTLVITNPSCGSPCVEACIETGDRAHDQDADEDSELFSSPEVESSIANENSPLLGNRSQSGFMLQPMVPCSAEPINAESSAAQNRHECDAVPPPRLSPSDPPSSGLVTLGSFKVGKEGPQRPVIPKLALGSLNPAV